MMKNLKKITVHYPEEVLGSMEMKNLIGGSGSAKSSGCNQSICTGDCYVDVGSVTVKGDCSWQKIELPGLSYEGCACVVENI